MARTVDEILRGLRGLIAEDESVHSGDQIDADAVHHAIQKFADELEAALKREKSQSWHNREMEELILRHEIEVAELKKQIGNAAAMREALFTVSKAFDDSLICTDSQMSMEECDRLDDVCHKVKAALAAPAPKRSRRRMSRSTRTTSSTASADLGVLVATMG